MSSGIGAIRDQLLCSDAGESVVRVSDANHNVLVKRLAVADRFLSRMKGLLGRSRLSQDEALLIIPCKGVHTFGMRFAIDVLFLDKEQQVIALISGLMPNRLTKIYASASSVLELPSGMLEMHGVCVGDRLIID